VADFEAFRKYLKRKGKKDHVVADLCERVCRFELHLRAKGAGLGGARVGDIDEFVAGAAGAPDVGVSRNDLRALALYYSSTGRPDLAGHASRTRERSIAKTRAPFKLAKFLGVDQDHIASLERVGIVTVDHMIAAGATPEARRSLARKTGVPLRAIEEYVKLSDLSRVGAIKTKRARLYLEAGLDTVDKIAALTPQAFRQVVIDYVERSGFDGIATLPKEAENAVRTARSLERLVIWEE